MTEFSALAMPVKPIISSVGTAVACRVGGLWLVGSRWGGGGGGVGKTSAPKGCIFQVSGI